MKNFTPEYEERIVPFESEDEKHKWIADHESYYKGFVSKCSSIAKMYEDAVGSIYGGIRHWRDGGNFPFVEYIKNDERIILTDSSRKRKQWLEEYLEWWAGTGETVKNNERGFRETQVSPQFLWENKLSHREIPGLEKCKRSGSSLFVAPTAWHKLFHPAWEWATSRAAEVHGIPMIVSSFSQTPLEEICGQKWFQIMPMKQEELMRETMEEAKSNDVKALVVTIDAQNGCTACRTSWGQDLVSMRDMPLLPRNSEFRGTTLKEYMSHHMIECRWKFIRKIRFILDKSPLPVYLKWIMTPEDAEKAIKMWAAGIYVSNHGWRQYDRGISTIEAVRRIRDKIGGEFPLIMDGGVRTGQDVMIARRAGADMVGIGRPIHYGLILRGKAGVKRVFEILDDEAHEALTLGL